jgi:hypothetical protein
MLRLKLKLPSSSISIHCLEIRRRVDNADIASLYEIISHKEVLLIRADLDVMRSDDTLVRIRAIQSLDVVEVTDVEGSDVVAEC